MLRSELSHLLSSLTSFLGPQQAKLELRWMKEAISQNSTSQLSLPAMVSRRLRGEPLQYILGTQPFGPLTLLTRQPVLIPRPETEDWTIRLSEHLRPTPRKPLSLLDLCTGSGCIPLLLCHLWPPGSVQSIGVDISQDAIDLATDNASHCNIQLAQHPSPASTLKDSASFPRKNSFLPLLANIRDPAFVLTAGLHPPFDLITANPPYIPISQYRALLPSVKDYEDPRALLGDPPDDPPSDPASDPQDGLSFYHAIAALVSQKNFLTPEGLVVAEVGAGQSEDVQRIFRDVGRMQHTEVWTDPWEIDRVVLATNS